MASRDISNKRIQILLGPASALSSFEFATEAECASMLMSAPAIRWDGLDFGMQASEQTDDRSLDDDATATLRGFLQFGGAVPFYFPKVTDTSSILRETYDLLKVRGTELALIERIGYVDRKAVFTAGDNINIYKVMTDGYTPDTEGDGGYAYLQNMLPRGEAKPWSIVADDPAAAVAITGGLTLSGAAGTLGLRGATYLGNNIGPRAIWASSDQDVAIVDNRGIIEIVGTGSAEVTASFPGGTTSVPCVVTGS